MLHPHDVTKRSTSVAHPEAMGDASMGCEDVAALANRLVERGHGVLASDESPTTLDRRLSTRLGECGMEVRRRFRDVLYAAKLGGSGVSGAILHEESYDMADEDGIPFVDKLHHQGVLPGVKLDRGLAHLHGGKPGETVSRGLDGLDLRCEAMREKGARFAKWRSALKHQPSELAVATNASVLAQYAAVCQAKGMAPIVEPEVLLDPDATVGDMAEATRRVVAETVVHLHRHGVAMEGVLLKLQMVVPGKRHSAPRDVMAQQTLRTLRQTVPPDVPGVLFLSGGQGEDEATANLNAINQLAQETGGAPWALTFSFGRALQASVLQLWKGNDENKPKAMAMAEALVRANAEAATGRFQGPHPSILADEVDLYETFRGHHQDALTEFQAKA